MSNSVALFNSALVQRQRLETTIGWKLRPEGLCQGDRCVVVRESEALFANGDNALADDLVDMRQVADLVGRPWAYDEQSQTLAVGAPREARHSAIHDLQAPDFSLPDLDGVTRSLSDYAGKKKLLFAFSSW